MLESMSLITLLMTVLVDLVNNLYIKNAKAITQNVQIMYSYDYYYYDLSWTLFIYRKLTIGNKLWLVCLLNIWIRFVKLLLRNIT